MPDRVSIGNADTWRQISAQARSAATRSASEASDMPRTTVWTRMATRSVASRHPARPMTTAARRKAPSVLESFRPIVFSVQEDLSVFRQDQHLPMLGLGQRVIRHCPFRLVDHP